MHLELKDELKKLERELSTLVARFLKIYDAVVDEPPGGNAPTGPQAPDAPDDQAREMYVGGFTTDYLTAYA